MIKQLIFCVLVLCLQAKNNLYADITFGQKDGKSRTIELAYRVNSNREQSGVKYGIFLHRFSIDNCIVKFPDNLQEYFAGFVSVPANCSPADIFNSVSKHGASFVFLDVQSTDVSKLSDPILQNPYAPLFLLFDGSDMFSHEEKADKIYIDISFPPVI